MDSFLGNSILVLAVTAASRSLCCERLLLANANCLGIQEHQIQWYILWYLPVSLLGLEYFWSLFS